MTSIYDKPKEEISNSCLYRVCWCTKYRRSLLDEDAQRTLTDSLLEAASKLSIELTGIQLFSDHVVLSIKTHPRLDIHRAVKHLKRHAYRDLKATYGWVSTRVPTLWTNSYYVGTLSGFNEDDMASFIERQPTRQ